MSVWKNYRIATRFDSWYWGVFRRKYEITMKLFSYYCQHEEIFLPNLNLLREKKKENTQVNQETMQVYVLNENLGNYFWSVGFYKSANVNYIWSYVLLWKLCFLKWAFYFKLGKRACCKAIVTLILYICISLKLEAPI